MEALAALLEATSHRATLTRGFSITRRKRDRAILTDFSVLKPGGHFLSKTFQGGTEHTVLDLLKKNFRSVHHVKPPASRGESVELYLLAKDFKGRD